MSKSLQVDIPDETAEALQSLASREGTDSSSLASEAIRHYVFLRRFRQLQEEIAPYAERAGYRTEEDIFRDVS